MIVRTVGQPVVLDRVSRAGDFEADPDDPTVARLIASGHLEVVPPPQAEFLPEPPQIEPEE